MARRRVDALRWGQVIVYSGGKRGAITDVERTTSPILGECIQITLDNGDVIRRAPATKLDVIGKKRVQ